MVISIFVLYQSCFAIEIQEASGSYRFGPDVSRKEGCHEAKKMAKANALEEYSSEFLLSDREIRCHENDLDHRVSLPNQYIHNTPQNSFFSQGFRRN